GKPRYGLPDAPLDSCSLVSASPSPTKTGIPFPFSLSAKVICLRFGRFLSMDEPTQVNPRRDPARERRVVCLASWLCPRVIRTTGVRPLGLYSTAAVEI